MYKKDEVTTKYLTSGLKLKVHKLKVKKLLSGVKINVLSTGKYKNAKQYSYLKQFTQ